MRMIDGVKSISRREYRNVRMKPRNIQMFYMGDIVLLLQNQRTLYNVPITIKGEINETYQLSFPRKFHYFLIST